MKLVNLEGLRSSLRGCKRLIGLDVGVKYLGVAVSDPACRIAIPLRVLTLKQSCFMSNVRELESMTKQYNATGFVIGYPLNLSGLRSTQSVKVNDFVISLQKTNKFDNIVYFWEDERFTSQVVESVLQDYEFHHCQHKAILDKLSAVNILQVCLDRLSHVSNSHHKA